MHISSNASTFLTSHFISPESLMLLGLPIWASLLRRDSIKILRMIFSNSIFVSTFPGAILSSTLSTRPTRGTIKRFSTSYTYVSNPTFRIGFAIRILTPRRTMFASSPLRPRFPSMKFLTTISASIGCNHISILTQGMG